MPAADANLFPRLKFYGRYGHATKIQRGRQYGQWERRHYNRLWRIQREGGASDNIVPFPAGSDVSGTAGLFVRFQTTQLYRITYRPSSGECETDVVKNYFRPRRIEARDSGLFSNMEFPRRTVDQKRMIRKRGRSTAAAEAPR
jgi:hypothetical protein